jgi:hypothetical protein
MSERASGTPSPRSRPNGLHGPTYWSSTPKPAHSALHVGSPDTAAPKIAAVPRILGGIRTRRPAGHPHAPEVLTTSPALAGEQATDQSDQMLARIPDSSGRPDNRR